MKKWIAVQALSLALLPAQVFAAPRAALTQSGRVRLNINADWRYQLGKAEGAEARAFDDLGWQRGGVPHSFSIPYFRRPNFYTGDGLYR